MRKIDIFMTSRVINPCMYMYMYVLCSSSLTYRLELLHSEESVVVAGEVIKGLLDLAFTLYQDHYLEEQAFPHTIQAAKASLLQIIEASAYMYCPPFQFDI